VVAVVDTNCDPSEVDYVIPGNDDALRAIRLFASKIAESVIEGSQFATDKQVAEVQAAQQAEAAAAAGAESTGEVAAEPAEDVSMEDVLGGGVRKQPAPADVEPEVPDARHVEAQTK
jgi:small subunit ribosomal protein S2